MKREAFFVRMLPARPSGEYMAIFLCGCGTEVSKAYHPTLKRGMVTCGVCKEPSRISKKDIEKGSKKGASTSQCVSNTRVYTIWRSMKLRCLTKSNGSYRNYGARGIKVCDRWLKFSQFIEDMGYPPDTDKTVYSLDRIDNNGHYEKSNCRWATKEEQMLNQRTTVMVEYNGRTLPLKKLAEELKAPYGLVYERYRKQNWNLHDSLFGK